MEVYSGPHLIIKYEQENSRLINTWKSSPPNDVEYRKELIEHRHIVEKIKPSQIMWILENLTFKVDDATKKWVDKNISKPIFKAGFIAKKQDGFDQVAFVVGNDVLAYIEVMGIFKENAPSGFKPKHFATEIEASNWLREEFITKDSKSGDQKLEITFKGTDDNGKAFFEVKEHASEITSTLKNFKSIIDENQFMKNNFEKYSSLTPREKETFKLIIKGNTNEQIAEKMNISHNTIRTHRNRIWKKLGIKHFRDCLKFECFFN
jgi:DNA-binding CsgD family transcriptional regulator